MTELRAVISSVGTEALRAALNFAEGLVATAAGEHQTARNRFENAVVLFDQSGAPFEAGRARIELAQTLLCLGQEKTARQEVGTALDCLRSIGAAREASRAEVFLSQLEMTAGKENSGRNTVTSLTRRELEVLSLVGQGLSNQEIAARLFLSEHTVHRHIANIFSKLNCSSRAAAVACAIRMGLL